MTISEYRLRLREIQRLHLDGMISRTERISLLRKLAMLASEPTLTNEGTS